MNQEKVALSRPVRSVLHINFRSLLLEEEEEELLNPRKPGEDCRLTLPYQ